MKRLLLPVILFIAGLFCSPRVFANHVFGGELLYKHVTGNTYTLTLTLYGDCGTSNPTAFDLLPIDTPLIHIYHGSYLDSFHVILRPDTNNGTEVSPVCPGQISNTTCNGGTLPGVKKFVYSANVTLNSAQPNWHFLFDGILGDGAIAGRSSNITNVYGAGSTNVYLEATLNNMLGPNSSPEYTTIPTPFYTVNIAQQYNQGAVDGDGDSLSYQLVNALNQGGNVAYYADPNITLSGAYPIVTDSGQFLFTPLNGQLSFKPSLIQNALVVCQVNEYKNGVLVGSSKREMTFVVLNLNIDNVQNTNATNISGGDSSANNVINLCVGSTSIAFDIHPLDTASNNVAVSYTSLPVNAVLNVQNNNTLSPDIHFNWNTASVPVGVYNFFVSYKNNACPIATTQTIAYTINIVNPYQVVSVSQTPTNCYFNANVTVVVKNGILPATITFAKDSSGPTSTISATDSISLQLPAGHYTGIVSAPGIPTCSVPFTFTIVDSGTFPYTPTVTGTLNYCLGDSATVLVAAPDLGANVQWYTAAGDSIPAPIPPTDTTGTFTWYVSQQLNNCRSDKEAVTVHVFDKPPINILSETGTVCVGEVVYLEATGGKNYDWEPSSKILTDRDGRQYIRVFEPVQYTLYAQSENGCRDSIKFGYTKIEQCCQFNYPSAFTPNGDGKNDKFRALVIGNMKFYELNIYDRWGKRLFWNSDMNAAWDGTFAGKECNADVYFYRVHAICYTGHEEDVTGTVTLIR